jgi:glyoxylase-like metal-dependent hydrolase (beta-lactamase superfamily II)
VFAPILLNAHNPGPMTGAGNNVYLLAQGRGAAALIDAGVGDAGFLSDLAAALGERDARLETVLVTHGHADHASGAPAIAGAYPGATFAKRAWPQMDGEYSVDWRSIGDRDVIDAGGEPLTALHTPGHSPDHLAFWHESSRSIFTGDLVVHGSSVMIHSSRGGNLIDYMASLQRLLALDACVLLPAHGPRIDKPDAILTGYLAHRRQREQQVLEALHAGHSTVEAIAESIYHGLDAQLMDAARENVRAHLEKLQTDGVAVNEMDRWRL